MRPLLFSLLLHFSFCFPCLAQPVVMYPGDTNNDGIANHFDLLPIGIAFGQIGPPRFPATLNWVPQQAEPWPQALPVSQINLSFVDCNGMDTINSLDVIAIALNYDSTQNNSFPPPAPYQPKLTDTCFSCPKPDIVVTFSKDIIDVMGKLEAYIQLRYPPNTPQLLGALGIAFDVEYYYTNEITDSMTQVSPDLFPPTRMYVAATHTDVSVGGVLPPAGRIGLASAGRGQNVFFETDTLFVVGFVIDNMIIRDEEADTFSLKISNVLILNRLEQVICLGKIITDSVVVLSAKILPKQKPAVYLSPNPVRETLLIESPDASLEQIEVFNLHGERFFSEKMQGKNRFELPTATLSPGIWLVVVQTRSGMAVKKFVKAE